MKVAVKVPLSPYSGYGNDGIGILSELIEYGVDPYIVPGTIIEAPLPKQVAELFTKEKAEDYDLTIHHIDPDGLGGRPGWFEHGGLTVGWTMWEFSNLLNSAGVASLRERMADYDVMIAYDDNTAQALAEYYDGPIRILQGGFLPHEYPYMERDFFDPDHFRFCMVGQLHDRKDPFLAIQAFQELKNDPDIEFEAAELHLKNSLGGAFHPAMNEVYAPIKIRIYNDIWDKDTLDRFYAQMHVLLAPSRGEGKNLPALEFQSTGGPVIATNWGGHTQWLNPQFSYPLDYDMRQLDHNWPNTFAARAKIDDLKRLMLHTYNNRAEVKRKGELASQIIPAGHSWEKVIHRLFDILGEFDPKIAHAAKVAELESE